MLGPSWGAPSTHTTKDYNLIILYSKSCQLSEALQYTYYMVKAIKDEHFYQLNKDLLNSADGHETVATIFFL